MNRKRIFSGIQPTGSIHIGNYLGAIRNWVSYQPEFRSIFCVVDLHAITTFQDPKSLRSKIREVAGILIASGIDPEHSILYIQSHIHAHAELAWILSCLTPMGWLRRMTQFKEKSEKQIKGVSEGLFDYPVLMAADILLYETDFVPVGTDQKQHLEFARDIAKKFNTTYGETLKIPEPLIPEEGGRIRALDNPLKKMSKSEEKRDNAIFLLDSADEIKSKIMKASTDSYRDIRFDKERPGIYNLLGIYELLTRSKRVEIEAHFEGKGYAVLKKELADVIIESLRPIQTRYREITGNRGYLDKILTRGAQKIRPVAEKVLANVKKRVGLG